MHMCPPPTQKRPLPIDPISSIEVDEDHWHQPLPQHRLRKRIRVLPKDPDVLYLSPEPSENPRGSLVETIAKWLESLDGGDGPEKPFRGLTKSITRQNMERHDIELPPGKTKNLESPSSSCAGNASSQCSDLDEYSFLSKNVHVGRAYEPFPPSITTVLDFIRKPRSSPEPSLEE